jgi:hypothetical protein
MALEPTETRVFEIPDVGELIKSPKGHSSTIGSIRGITQAT